MNRATKASSGTSRGHRPSQASAAHAKPILRLEAGRVDRGGLAGVHRRPFAYAYDFTGSIQGGNRSAESISSIVGLGRVTANRVPSTMTSGASGRVL